MKLVNSAAKPGPAVPARVRQQVQALLNDSPGYCALPAEAQRGIAQSTARVAAYLVDPQGLMAQEFRQPLLHGVVCGSQRPADWADAIQPTPARYDALVAAVDFPSFVASLIQGVFQALVRTTLAQTQAYIALLAAVSATVDQFMQDNISDAAARDALVGAFPDAFCWSAGKARQLTLHAVAGSPALRRLADALGLREPMIDPKRHGESARQSRGLRRLNQCARFLFRGDSHQLPCADDDHIGTGLPRHFPNPRSAA